MYQKKSTFKWWHTDTQIFGCERIRTPKAATSTTIQKCKKFQLIWFSTYHTLIAQHRCSVLSSVHTSTGAARRGTYIVHMHALSQTHTHYISLQNQFLSSTIRDERKSIERNKMKITTKTHIHVLQRCHYTYSTHMYDVTPRAHAVAVYSPRRSHIRINSTVDATDNRKTQNKIEERKRNETKKKKISFYAWKLNALCCV